MRWSVLLAMVAEAGKHVYRAGSAPTITHNTLVKRGVILWAHGRSATDTYCLTLRRSARMNFCRHMKEGFNTKHASGVLLRKKRLEKCGKSGELLTHIKPGHVRNSSRTDLRSPEDLFAAARGAGFEVVVAVYRHNALARAVSSFEIHRYAGLKREDSGTLAARRREAKLRQRASEDFCHKPGALKRHFETERDLYDRGLRAARANGLKLLRFSFEAVTGDLCGTIKKTTTALGCETRCRCQPTLSKHQRTSRRDRSLAGRTSPEAAKCITAELAGDVRYEWMLNLTATRPPKAVEEYERQLRRAGEV